jgi:hypothetical protein
MELDRVTRPVQSQSVTVAAPAESRPCALKLATTASTKYGRTNLATAITIALILNWLPIAAITAVTALTTISFFSAPVTRPNALYNPTLSLPNDFPDPLPELVHGKPGSWTCLVTCVLVMSFDITILFLTSFLHLSSSSKPRAFKIPEPKPSRNSFGNTLTRMVFQNLLETQEFKEYLELARKYYLAGYVPADAATMSNFTTDMKAGKVFCKVESGKPFHYEERAASWGIPIIDVNLTKPVVQTRDCTGSMQAISKICKNPTMALKFLELFNTDKYLNNLINFGIEGKHFVKVSVNVIDYPKGVTAQNSGYKPGTLWMFGNQYLNYFWKGENTSKWDAFKKFNALSTSAASLGFNFDPDPVKNEMAACTQVVHQCGSVDLRVKR